MKLPQQISAAICGPDGLWNRYGPVVLRLAILLMAAAAVLRLGIEFSRLVVDWEVNAAEDLKYRYSELHLWFSGESLYTRFNRVYPPATYVILWPLLGWLPLAGARWLWAMAAAAALTWLAAILIRESGAETTKEKVFVALMLLSMNGTGLQIGHGQFALLILPLMLAALLLLRRPPSWSRDCVIASLFLPCLVKPTVSAPFFWLILSVGGMRPAALTAAGYGALTLFAATFQPGGLVPLLDNWLAGSHQTPKGFIHGYGNLQSWLALYGLDNWTMILPVAVLALLGIWIYFHRTIDIRVLIAICALFARMWTYHLPYDDLLIILPMMVLFREIKESTNPRELLGWGLLLSLVAFLNLARLSDIATWRYQLIIISHQLAWGAMMILLLRIAHRLRKTAPAPIPESL